VSNELLMKGELVEDAETFGVWLARQLRRQGMSQADLATELDVTRAAVSAWVTGRAEPRLDKIKDIERILGLTAGSVMTREDAPDAADNLFWYHRPGHADGGRELGNAAAFAFDADLSVLAREATQNSLDERYDAERPVRVRYTLHEISGERLHRFLQVLRWNELEPHFAAAADRRQKVGRVLANGLAELRQSGTLLLLRVDDYNACGLTGTDYDDGRFAAVVRRQLDSHKRGTAGGSYGLGKATLWATSQLGLVLINSTLSEPYGGRSERRLIGRLDLPWRQVGDEDYAGPAWLGVPDPQRGGAARSWWADEQTVDDLFLKRESDDPGASFLIVGAHDGSGEANGLEGMHNVLVESLARSFWASMISPAGAPPMLEASVTTLRNGVVVVAEEQVDPQRFEPARSRAMRAFLEDNTVPGLTSTDDVVQGSVMLTIPPVKEDARGQPIEHEAVLLLTSTGEEDPAPNRLVCMRSSRMVIMERPVTDLPMGSPTFQAVLLAGHAAGSDSVDAETAERFLRTAEPPEHNDWRKTEDLAATYARGAATRIRDFRAAMMDEVRRILRRPEEKSDDGPAALRELLNLDPPPPPRSPGFPTVKSVEGSVGTDGAWRVRVEVRLPERTDPWLLTPVLRFATRSGPKPEAGWKELTPESGCEVTDAGNLLFTVGARTAAFSGTSDVGSHPVAAHMAIAEVDLRRVKETTS
jgi:transcriptional regulator with XRE-family HTH domain